MASAASTPRQPSSPPARRRATPASPPPRAEAARKTDRQRHGGRADQEHAARQEEELERERRAGEDHQHLRREREEGQHHHAAQPHHDPAETPTARPARSATRLTPPGRSGLHGVTDLGPSAAPTARRMRGIGARLGASVSARPGRRRRPVSGPRALSVASGRRGLVAFSAGLSTTAPLHRFSRAVGRRGCAAAPPSPATRPLRHVGSASFVDRRGAAVGIQRLDGWLAVTRFPSPLPPPAPLAVACGRLLVAAAALGLRSPQKKQLRAAAGILLPQPTQVFFMPRRIICRPPRKPVN